jgi:hypothetical protein
MEKITGKISCEKYNEKYNILYIKKLQQLIGKKMN